MTEIRFEPTLFIFLGTSAGQVGWRLKSLLHKAYGDIPVLRFLWVDADSSRDDQAGQWFAPDNERVDLIGFNGDSVLANLAAYPTIRAWWLRESKLKPGYIQRGAKQIRLFGRLALFRMFSDRSAGPAFIDKLRASVEAIQNIESFDATEKMSTDNMRFIVDRGSARVFIVFSTCGGTGSSMTFDVAYLCRNLFRNSGVAVIGVSILPPVIDKAIKNETQIQWEKIRANTYAWFKENDYLLNHPYWNVLYPEGAAVNIQAPPFNLNFVVDLGNQAGNRLNSEDDIFTLIAQAIFLDTGSSIGGAMRGFNTNVSVLLEEFRGRQRAYSSLAAASLIYPAEKILNYCSSRFGLSLIKDGLLAQPIPEQVLEEALSLAGRLRLRDNQLLMDLLSERQVTQLNAAVIRKAAEIEKVRNLLGKQETLDAEERERQCGMIAIKAAERLRDISTQIDHEIAILAIQRGALFAQAVLDAMTMETDQRDLIAESTTSLNGFRSRIIQQGVTEDDLIHARNSYNGRRDHLRSMEADPKQAMMRLVAKKTWLRQLNQSKDESLRWLSDLNQISLQLAAQREAANIYDQLVHLSRNMIGLLAEMVQNARRVMSEMEKTAEENLKPSTLEQGIYEMALEAVDATYIRTYFEQHAKNLDATTCYRTVVGMIEIEDLPAVVSWSEADMGKQIAAYARSVFAAGVENTSLLDALADYHGVKAKGIIQDQFDHLVQHCHPFWQYNRDSGVSGFEGKSIIGVTDEHDELIPDKYRDNLQFEIKSTGFKHEIHAARILHGLPAFLLSGMDEYKTYYDSKRKGIDPLHILREAVVAEDVFPEENQDARRLFAVSAAFSYIVQISSWYYFDPRKEYKAAQIHPGRENQLAQGRENAETAFIHHPEFISQADGMIEKEIVRIGNETAIQLLEKAVLEHKETLAKMAPENELRRQYEKEILALQDKQRQLGHMLVD